MCEINVPQSYKIQALVLLLYVLFRAITLEKLFIFTCYLLLTYKRDF